MIFLLITFVLNVFSQNFSYQAANNIASYQKDLSGVVFYINEDENYALEAKLADEINNNTYYFNKDAKPCKNGWALPTLEQLSLLYYYIVANENTIIIRTKDAISTFELVKLDSGEELDRATYKDAYEFVISNQYWLSSSVDFNNTPYSLNLFNGAYDNIAATNHQSSLFRVRCIRKINLLK